MTRNPLQVVTCLCSPVEFTSVFFNNGCNLGSTIFKSVHPSFFTHYKTLLFSNCTRVRGDRSAGSVRNQGRRQRHAPEMQLPPCTNGLLDFLVRECLFANTENSPQQRIDSSAMYRGRASQSIKIHRTPRWIS